MNNSLLSPSYIKYYPKSSSSKRNIPRGNKGRQSLCVQSHASYRWSHIYDCCDHRRKLYKFFCRYRESKTKRQLHSRILDSPTTWGCSFVWWKCHVLVGESNSCVCGMDLMKSLMISPRYVHHSAYSYCRRWLSSSKNLDHAAKSSGLNVLGIETSCDDTAAAVVNMEKEILGESLFNQGHVHRE